MSRQKATLSILIGLCLSHCFNDLQQAVVVASYPLLKNDLTLTFTQMGIITLIYQISASILQPITGYVLDKRHFAYALPTGMCFSIIGLTSFALANSFYSVLIGVFLIGFGSSILHPEASRIAFTASNGKRGLAQSLFQVGGNFGRSIAPLLVALIVAPYTRKNILWFILFSIIGILIMIPVSKWYQRHLYLVKASKKENPHATKSNPLTQGKTLFAITILMILIFSKYVYMASLNNYYTFYLIEKFNVTIPQSQLYLSTFLIATAIGTLIGGPLGDKIGRKYVIWLSILGTAPFSLLLPYASLTTTILLSFGAGLMLSSAFPAILIYAQELLPQKLGLISGLFFGLAFGIAGIASAVLGNLIDHHGIEMVYKICSFSPLLGVVTYFLPDIEKKIKN